MENYLFNRIGVNRNEILEDYNQFIKVIRFCLLTTQRPRHDIVNLGLEYFNGTYVEFRNAIINSDWDNLIRVTYSSPGVKQKVGSLILEVFIHYAGLNLRLENKLFVPIDSHVKRIFSDCLGAYDVSERGLPTYPGQNTYSIFQQKLMNNTYNNLPRIYFDYLWFVGKVFCTSKINENDINIYKRSYRLCSICWLKDICINPDRWNYL
ncbi:MAG: hypothetical protein Q8Q47_06095 [Ignavibacteriaceae bacterium]|nr:hypothetical protein [Ignavibacteriaceae bacterium]